MKNIRRALAFWHFRRQKYYNPRGMCFRCGCAVTMHTDYCPGCQYDNKVDAALEDDRCISLYNL